jgi:hypothetical protein
MAARRVDDVATPIAAPLPSGLAFTSASPMQLPPASGLPLLTAPQLTQTYSDLFGSPQPALRPSSLFSPASIFPAAHAEYASTPALTSAAPAHAAFPALAAAPLTPASSGRFLAHTPIHALLPQHRLVSVPGPGAGLGVDYYLDDDDAPASLSVPLATPMPSMTAPAARAGMDMDDGALGGRMDDDDDAGPTRMTLGADSAALLAAGAQGGFLRDPATACQAAPDPTPAEGPRGPCHVKHHRALATVPEHAPDTRVYMAWDLVPLRLLAPLYVPRGQHHRRDRAPAAEKPMAPSTAAQVPAKYRKRRLFGAARISVLKAMEKTREEEEDAADAQPAAGTGSGDAGGEQDSFSLVPRAVRLLQSRVDAYTSLPLMIYRRYVQCLCGHADGCPESHAHWEEAADVWPRGTSLPKVEVSLLRAHRLEALVQVCEYADTEAKDDRDADASNSVISKLLPVTCRFALPGPYEPLVQVPGAALPGFARDGSYVPGRVPPAEEEVPTRAAMLRGLARIRQQEHLEESVLLCEMSSAKDCHDAGGACGNISSAIASSVSSLKAAAEARKQPQDAAERRRLMAKFPVHEDGPSDANSNAQPPASTPAPVPAEHKMSAKEAPGKKVKLPEWASDPDAVAAFIKAAPAGLLAPNMDPQEVAEYLASAAAAGRCVGPCPVVMGMMETVTALKMGRWDHADADAGKTAAADAPDSCGEEQPGGQ